MKFGHGVLGCGIIGFGIVCLATKDFTLGLPLPDDFFARMALAYAAAAFLLPIGAALIWRRTMATAAAFLTGFYMLFVFGLAGIPYAPFHLAEYGTYSNLAEELAIVAAALILLATNPRLDPVAAARLTRAAQCAFAVCALFFGGAHFVYMNLTAPLVPSFLPPSQLFWGYATGVFHILGGLAILAGVKDRLAAILLTVMYALFTPMVHIPMLLADPFNHFLWSENAFNVALTGSAWVVAESLQARRPARPLARPPGIGLNRPARLRKTRCP